ncbi:protein fem-1 homolog CG6966-like [Toxorhynchites rutilus septentrionalis]|uniref:protein fem-1 homolog CG6966-like n=1 Tax=Toxorhynchites rutilus septentrionalis TaxID=329112 RepID=UPI00247891D9|nr:protein fem-1 homolog CG6966-like [Toxorhynchites rutilus septentrionalis]
MSSQHDTTLDQISDELIAECKAVKCDGGFLSGDLMRRIENLPQLDRKKVAEKQTDGSCSALFIACNQGNIQIIEYLITLCDANSDHTNYHRCEDDRMQNITPLGNACATGNIRVVKCLIRLGCDVDGPSEGGATPLQIACLKSQRSIVRYLIRHGADLRKPSYDGTTCLMNAVQSVPIMCDLIINGADVNAADFHNNAALHYAIKRRNLESICLLLRYGADPFVKNCDGDDALQSACIHGADEIADYLMDLNSYSPQRLADANELLGSSCIDVDSDRQKALQYWRKAHYIRSSGINYIPKTPPISRRCAFENAIEFTTRNALGQIAANDDALRMQSLLICERILGIDHEETLRRLMRQGSMYEYSFRFQRCLDMWLLALQIRIQKHSILHSDTNETAQSIVMLMMEELDGQSHNSTIPQFQTVLTVFRILSSNIIQKRHLIEVQSSQQQQKNYDQIVRCLIHLIWILVCTARCEVENELIRNSVLKLTPNDIRSFISNNTLLHLSVSSSNLFTEEDSVGASSVFPNLKVTKLLLKCGANVNALNRRKSTPLHLASLECNQSGEIIQTLVDHGAHIDLPNMDDHRPSKLLATNPLISTPLGRHISLRCLSANAIIENNIPYQNQLPPTLERFVRMHDSK